MEATIERVDAVVEALLGACAGEGLSAHLKHGDAGGRLGGPRVGTTSALHRERICLKEPGDLAQDCTQRCFGALGVAAGTVPDRRKRHNAGTPSAAGPMNGVPPAAEPQRCACPSRVAATSGARRRRN